MSPRPMIMVAVVLLIAALACGGPGPQNTSMPAAATPVGVTRTAELSELKNDVQAREASGADWQTADDGQSIPTGGGVKTGAESRARLDISDQTIVRLAANTEFQLIELSSEPTDPVTRLQLEAGKLWVSVTKSLGGGTFEIETPEGVATVRGSLMSAEYWPANSQVIVTCLEGKCGLTNAAGKVVDLIAGQQSEIPGASQLPTRPHAIDAAQLKDWLDNFPEAKKILGAMTAVPPSPVPPSPVPTTGATTATGQAGGGQAAQTACDHPYFPLRSGANWNYSTNAGGGAVAWTVTDVQGDTKKASADMTWDNGQTQGIYAWQCTPAGILSYQFGLLAAMPPGAQMKVTRSSGVFLPAAELLVPGYSWTNAFKIEISVTGVAIKSTITHSAKYTVSGNKPVTVNGKTYDGVQITGATTTDYQPAAPGHMEGTVTMTLARGVGMVERTDASDVGGSLSAQLTDFTLP